MTWLFPALLFFGGVIGVTIILWCQGVAFWDRQIDAWHDERDRRNGKR